MAELPSGTVTFLFTDARAAPHPQAAHSYVAELRSGDLAIPGEGYMGVRVGA